MRNGGSACSSPHGPSARASAARISLDDGRLRDGRSSVEGLSAAALPGFPSPRLTFADRLRGDKAPDVLIETLALIDAPLPAYLVGDGPAARPADPADPEPAGERSAAVTAVLAAVRPAVLPGGIAAWTGSSSFSILSFLSPRC